MYSGDHKKLVKTLDALKAMALAYCLEAENDSDAQTRANFIRGRLYFTKGSDGHLVFGAHGNQVHDQDGQPANIPVEGLSEFLRRELVKSGGPSKESQQNADMNMMFGCPKSAPYRCDNECWDVPCE